MFELEQPFLIGLPLEAIAPAPQGQLGFGGTYRAANPGRAVGIFVKQAFVRFKELGGDQSSTLRLGRFEFGDGLEFSPEGLPGASWGIASLTGLSGTSDLHTSAGLSMESIFRAAHRERISPW